MVKQPSFWSVTTPTQANPDAVVFRLRFFVLKSTGTPVGLPDRHMPTQIVQQRIQDFSEVSFVHFPQPFRTQRHTECPFDVGGGEQQVGQHRATVHLQCHLAHAWIMGRCQQWEAAQQAKEAAQQFWRKLHRLVP